MVFFKRMKDFSTYKQLEPAAYDITLESYEGDTSSITFAPFSVDQDDVGNWLIFERYIFLITEVQPDEQQDSVTLAEPMKIFDRDVWFDPVEYAGTDNNPTVLSLREKMSSHQYTTKNITWEAFTQLTELDDLVIYKFSESSHPPTTFYGTHSGQTHTFSSEVGCSCVEQRCLPAVGEYWANKMEQMQAGEYREFCPYCNPNGRGYYNTTDAQKYLGTGDHVPVGFYNCEKCGGDGYEYNGYTPEKCTVCKGTGTVNQEPCTYCDGKGTIGEAIEPRVCSLCGGTGKDYSRPVYEDPSTKDGTRHTCAYCGGTGFIYKTYSAQEAWQAWGNFVAESGIEIIWLEWTIRPPHATHLWFASSVVNSYEQLFGPNPKSEYFDDYTGIFVQHMLLHEFIEPTVWRTSYTDDTQKVEYANPRYDDDFALPYLGFDNRLVIYDYDKPENSQLVFQTEPRLIYPEEVKSAMSDDSAVDNVTTFNVYNYFKMLRDAYKLYVNLELRGNQLVFAIYNREDSWHNVPFGDGHAILESQNFGSDNTVSKVTCIFKKDEKDDSSYIHYDYYLSSDGCMMIEPPSEEYPYVRAKGRWVVLSPSVSDSTTTTTEAS